MIKTTRFRVTDHTKGANKCVEIDEAGEETINLSGSLYLRKSAVGTLPVGTIFTVTVAL